MTVICQEIVKAILKEFNGRAGFDHWWDELDSDIKKEIRTALREHVAACLKRHE